MAAPAIVLVSFDPDPSVVPQLTHIASSMQAMRPDLIVELVNTGQVEHATQLLGRHVTTGTTEITLIPLDITSASEFPAELPDFLTTLRHSFPHTSISTARPLGPVGELLSILDQRVRAALAVVNAVEVDGLVLAASDGGDVRGKALLARRARQWGTHHKLPVQLATNDESGRGTAQAIMTLRSQGRRHIAVGSLFLTTDARYRAQLQAARKAGAIAVTEPIGDDPRILEIILARYAFAAMEMLKVDPI